MELRFILKAYHMQPDQKRSSGKPLSSSDVVDTAFGASLGAATGASIGALFLPFGEAIGLVAPILGPMLGVAIGAYMAKKRSEKIARERDLD
jgi:uncharacterized protein YqgC (DUF456 family)